MSPVSPTRTNLINRKEQMRAASDGARLLRSKRDALLREFLKMIDTVLASRTELEDLCRKATNALHLARARDGPESLRSAAMASARRLDLEISRRRVWGLPVPEITARHLVRSPGTRGYSLAGTSARVDEAAEAFEKVMHTVFLIASQEVRLKRLGEEIRRTSRRVNALEQSFIPALADDMRYILNCLEERSREDIFRLKRLKAGKAAARSTP